jgi:hypothetical protein
LYLMSEGKWKIAVWLVGSVLIGLGIFMLVTPKIAAPLFASASAAEATDTYIRALAIRDIAIGALLMICPTLSVAATTAAIATICLVPCGDLLLVWLSGGDFLSLLPHLFSLICLTVLAAWGSRVA